MAACATLQNIDQYKKKERGVSRFMKGSLFARRGEQLLPSSASIGQVATPETRFSLGIEENLTVLRLLEEILRGLDNNSIDEVFLLQAHHVDRHLAGYKLYTFQLGDLLKI